MSVLPIIRGGAGRGVGASSEGQELAVAPADHYGHLMPGSESEAAGMLGAYLEREVGEGASRTAT